jgi:hypothetical protein
VSAPVAFAGRDFGGHELIGIAEIARLRLAGLPRTGDADFSAEKGSGSTPREGAWSMATVAPDRPRPAMI